MIYFDMDGLHCQAGKYTAISLDCATTLFYRKRAKIIHSHTVKRRMMKLQPGFSKVCHKLLSHSQVSPFADNTLSKGFSDSCVALDNPKPSAKQSPSVVGTYVSHFGMILTDYQFWKMWIWRKNDRVFQIKYSTTSAWLRRSQTRTTPLWT